MSEGNGDGRKRGESVPFRDAEAGSGELPLSQLDDFHCPARDEKGAHQQITFSVPPFMVRQIDIILHSRRFPYATAADLLRHALKRHIDWTAAIRATIPTHITSAMESLLAICRDEEIRIKMEEIFSRAEKLAQYYFDKGEHNEAIRLLNTIKQQITDVPAGMWRNEFLAQFTSKWAPYLAGITTGGKA
jgi:hypothetical protein